MSRTFAVILLLLAAPAGAEEINFATATAERPNVVLARTGIDHALVLDLGYRRVLSWAGRPLVLGVDLETPAAGMDFGDYALRAGAAAPLLGGGGRGWKLIGALGPTLRATENAVATARALGLDAHLTGGYYARWWLAGELGIDWAATTHIAHSDAYRANYPGAKDGWYASAGGTIYAGLTAGVTIRSVDLVLRAGMPRSADLGPQTIPFYALLGVNVTLPR